MSSTCELTILMPCLNEAQTLATCIRKARSFLDRNGIDGEVLIADNGSTDSSRDIAIANGATVVAVTERGYGAALMGGIRAARGRSIIMGDADDSYDFSKLEAFVERLRAGDELVMGNRFRGGIALGAMPPLHRYLGNPVLTGIGRLFFRSTSKDFHCGLRGFDRRAIERLELQTTGMEFASEMVVKATLHGLRVSEVPTTLSPDGRNRPPHLRSWRDGWRHLRFMLIYSPRWLFMYPGVGMMGLGLAIMLWLLPGERSIGGVSIDVHTLVYAAGLILIGLQSVLFALFTKVFGLNLRLLPPDPKFDRLLRTASLERGLIAGAVLVVVGMAGSIRAVMGWEAESFGPQQPQELMRIVVPSLTAILVGLQLVFASFFLSVLQLKHLPARRSDRDE